MNYFLCHLLETSSKSLYSIMLSNNDLKLPHLRSFQQFSQNRQNIFQRRAKVFTFLSNRLSLSQKIILELEQWTNGNQKLSQCTNRKQGGATPENIVSRICFPRNRVKSDKDDISSEAHLQNSNQQKLLFQTYLKSFK